jgi:hypothetical protein
MRATLQVSGITLRLVDCKIIEQLFCILWFVEQEYLFPNNSSQIGIFKAVNCITLIQNVLANHFSSNEISENTKWRNKTIDNESWEKAVRKGDTWN